MKILDIIMLNDVIVTATVYKVRKIQSLADNRHAVFLNLQEQSVVFSCERDAADPRILHELVLETDEYGNVLQSAQVAYPRKHIPGGLPQKVKDEQGEMHITCTKNNYTNDAIDDATYRHYRLRLPYEVQSFEANFAAPQTALYTVAELLLAINGKGEEGEPDYIPPAGEVDYSATPALGQMRLLSHSKSLFYNDLVTEPMEHFGELESLAIPCESYTLAFTPGILGQSYGSKVSPSMLKTDGAYVDLDEDGKYWLPSGTVQYNSPATKFYTPEAFIDPWGKITTITYGGNEWLLPQSVTDALGNVTSVEAYDWRNLQPMRMKDANDNITEMLYDALGMPVAMAVKGKDDGTECDTLDGIDPEGPDDIINQEAFWQAPEANAADLLKDATWRCVYDLDNLPTSVAMIGRTRHTLPIVIPTEEGSFIALTYSDGFGREIMQKVQCEPTTSNGNKGWDSPSTIGMWTIRSLP